MVEDDICPLSLVELLFNVTQFANNNNNNNNKVNAICHCGASCGNRGEAKEEKGKNDTEGLVWEKEKKIK